MTHNNNFHSNTFGLSNGFNVNSNFSQSNGFNNFNNNFNKFNRSIKGKLVKGSIASKTKENKQNYKVAELLVNN